jgi:hypothetical protein
MVVSKEWEEGRRGRNKSQGCKLERCMLYALHIKDCLLLSRRFPADSPIDRKCPRHSKLVQHDLSSNPTQPPWSGTGPFFRTAGNSSTAEPCARCHRVVLPQGRAEECKSSSSIFGRHGATIAGRGVPRGGSCSATLVNGGRDQNGGEAHFCLSQLQEDSRR